ncbi:head-tail connector protein [Gordonia phage Syleon]|uniref:Uncharacterized protein n=3 Tax=Octobienvirus TaxID=3044779 RepID=A0AAE8Y6F6_9CAUD|nr:head-tail connector protein [Gordonia Phage Sephiroth]YP_010246538.1 head-tail connector protein [Gordonia phage Kudefre]YP_010246679.1 head-tail connector protein [Gordonia phage Syleon]QGH75749.1 hypothetical protein SEA_SYLEON_20 [Gordonia phage Syleon]QNN99364.1 hypothetical protein SEA_SEPHIROTH_20 [Gordonia Phage Sephiroth]UDL15360.1 hypothetical protein SEA_KUDEFRE_19 [Gordonia phage Kudefre]
MEVRLYPDPNPGLAKFLLSASLNKALAGVAVEAAALYMALAPKRSGRLASSATPRVVLSGKPEGPDRWVASVQVRAPYSVWNEMGAGPRKHPKSTGKDPWYGPFEGSFTFKKVLEGMKGNG